MLLFNTVRVPLFLHSVGASQNSPARSCEELFRSDKDARSGVFWIGGTKETATQVFLPHFVVT